MLTICRKSGGVRNVQFADIFVLPNIFCYISKNGRDDCKCLPPVTWKSTSKKLGLRDDSVAELCRTRFVCCEAFCGFWPSKKRFRQGWIVKLIVRVTTA